MKLYKEMHREQKSIPKGGLLMSDYITRERNLTLLTDYYEYMVNKVNLPIAAPNLPQRLE